MDYDESCKKQDVSSNPLLLEPIIGKGAFLHVVGDGSRGRRKAENQEQEVVGSWTARKLEFRPLSSKDVDKARLGDSCIWPRHRVSRGESDKKEILLVNLVIENEGAE